MYKIAAVGRQEEQLIFRLFGAECFFTDTEKETADVLKKLSREDYAIIFLDKKFAQLAAEYENSPLPIVVVLGHKRFLDF